MMKRRNMDSAKLRRTIKKGRIGDGVFNGGLVYMKLLLAWALLMMADFLLGFRFEYLWPFWLLVRSIYDSFRYQGLAFSVFFVCVTVTSDLVCFLFIPVQWLFVLASTYVWLQYVWHADRGVCLPTVSLCLLFVYIEASVRLKEISASRTAMPFTLDLCRPFAAHCIGYPVVTLGFGVKSYVSYKYRLRKQREIAKHNEIYARILTEALPAEWSPAYGAAEAAARAALPSNEEDSAAAAGAAADDAAAAAGGWLPAGGQPSAIELWLDRDGRTSVSHPKPRRSSHSVVRPSGTTRRAAGNPTTSGGGPAASLVSSAAEMQRSSVGGDKSAGGWPNTLPGRIIVAVMTWLGVPDPSGSGGVSGNGPGHASGEGAPGTGSTDEEALDDFDDAESSRGSNAMQDIGNVSGAGASISASKRVISSGGGGGAKKSSSRSSQSAGRPMANGNLPNNSGTSSGDPKAKSTDLSSNNYYQLSDSAGGQNLAAGENSTNNSSSNNNNKDTCCHSDVMISKKSQSDRRLELDVQRARADARAARLAESDLRQQLQQLNSVDKSARFELQRWRTKYEQLETKFHNMMRTRETDKLQLQQLERKLLEEQRARSAMEQQLDKERKAAKKAEEQHKAAAAEKKAAVAASKEPHCGDACRQRRRDADGELKQLRRETRARDEQLAQLEGELAALRQYREAHNAEVLMSALATMKEKNAHLEKSLSAENRLKQDLFSALGDAKHQMDAVKQELKRKDVELDSLRRRLADRSPSGGTDQSSSGRGPITPPPPAPTANTQSQQQQNAVQQHNEQVHPDDVLTSAIFNGVTAYLNTSSMSSVNAYSSIYTPTTTMASGNSGNAQPPASPH